MAVRLNKSGYDHAQELVSAGRVVLDACDDWSAHQPSSDEQNEFIAEHGWAEYSKWHLGADDEADRETQAHYRFLYGDFETVHRCGVLAAESRAGQRNYYDIENAAAHLHGMLKALRSAR
jgi:hypothetical protein